MEIHECYQILGVTKHASDDELRRAKQTLCKKYHPDRNPGDKEAEKKMMRITEAYATIEAYRKEKNAGKFSIKDVFYAGPKEKPTKHRPQQPKAGSDVHTTIEITYAESLAGCKKVVTTKREERCPCGGYGGDMICPHCSGTGFVTKNATIEFSIPRNITNGQTIKIVGRGNAGENGGASGNLIIKVHVREDDRFVRRGNDLYVMVEVSFPELLRGTQKTIPTIYGDEVYNIPPHVKIGSKLPIRGKGAYDPKTKETGNQYVVVRLSLPVIETAEQWELVERVQKELYDVQEGGEFI